VEEKPVPRQGDFQQRRLRAREMRKRAQALIDELGFDLDPF